MLASTCSLAKTDHQGPKSAISATHSSGIPSFCPFDVARSTPSFKNFLTLKTIFFLFLRTWQASDCAELWPILQWQAISMITDGSPSPPLMPSLGPLTIGLCYSFPHSPPWVAAAGHAKSSLWMITPPFIFLNSNSGQCTVSAKNFGTELCLFLGGSWKVIIAVQ